MQNKKLFIILGSIVGVIVVAAAAFIAGRLLNRGATPLGIFPLGGGPMAQGESVMIKMEPASELPTRPPEANGLFVERQDNTIVIQSLSMDMGRGGGVIVVEGGRGADETSPSLHTSFPGTGDAPKVEVVVTSETMIYRDATEMPAGPPSGEETTVEQKVAEGSLDELSSQTMVMVWGRKVGDRIIAEVLFYSNPVMFKATTP